MSAPGSGRPLLTYCSNIHPGSSLSEIERNLDLYSVEVKKRVSPDAPFGLGLWLSSEAARELSAPSRLTEFKEKLAQRGLFVFTLNGFPYGRFHGGKIKQRVYLPDWRDEARLEYTCALARILAGLLPAAETEGSISTLPLAYRPSTNSESDLARMAEMIARCASELHRIEHQTGRAITVNLEPEPFCVLESAAKTAEFFSNRLFAGGTPDLVACLTGENRAAAEGILRRHIGVCLDACHSAVGFEDPAEVLRVYRDAGVRIGKMQLSAGLKIAPVTCESLQALRIFSDETYLHQVTEKRDGEIRRYLDLPEALANAPDELTGCEWRVHFHVPIFAEGRPPFETTRDDLAKLLDLIRTEPVTRHLEVETYTWDVLPSEWRGLGVVDAIAREIEWAAGRLAR